MFCNCIIWWKRNYLIRRSENGKYFFLMDSSPVGLLRKWKECLYLDFGFTFGSSSELTVSIGIWSIFVWMYWMVFWDELTLKNWVLLLWCELTEIWGFDLMLQMVIIWLEAFLVWYCSMKTMNPRSWDLSLNSFMSLVCLASIFPFFLHLCWSRPVNGLDQDRIRIKKK